MATKKQIEAAKRNIKKAQEAWQNMTPRQRALRQPQVNSRATPGVSGKGEYYHIIVRPKTSFTSFRVHDVGKPGGIERVAGHRRSGSWATHAWLVHKGMAHIEDDRIVADVADAKELLASLGSEPVHIKGDIFRAKDRRNVPERDKPTEVQRAAYSKNIKKAQSSRRKK